MTRFLLDLWPVAGSFRVVVAAGVMVGLGGSVCGVAQAALITGIGNPNNIAPQATVSIPFVNPSQYSKAIDQIVSDGTLYDDAYAVIMQSSPAEITLTWANPVSLTQLSAYITSNVPAGVNPFLDRETASVQFLVSTATTGAFTSVGTVADTSFTLAADDPTKIWSVAAVSGNWTGIRRAQYLFTKAGVNNSRVGEVIATVPEPGMLGLLGVGLLAGPWLVRRRRLAIHRG